MIYFGRLLFFLVLLLSDNPSGAADLSESYEHAGVIFSGRCLLGRQVSGSVTAYRYETPIVSSLERVDTTTFQRPLEPLLSNTSSECRYNVSFKCPRVQAGVTSTNIPQLRAYVRSFTPNQWSDADSRPWYHQDVALYHAYLMFPPVGTTVTGGIVWLHGSTGTSPCTFDTCRHFASRGHVVLLPNLFSPFRTGSTAANQLAIPLENSILAAYRALHLLRTCPTLNGKPISLGGESRGGIITDLCARELFSTHLSPDLGFDSFVSVDGFPMFSGLPYTRGSRLLVVHGQQDRWTKLANTRRHLRDFGGDAIVILKEFPCPHGVLQSENPGWELVPTFNDCSVEERGDEGFAPLMVRGRVVIYTGSWKVGRWVPWGWVPRFVRRFFQVEEFEPQQTIPWRGFKTFLRQYSKIRFVRVGHRNARVKEEALAEIDTFLTPPPSR